jgi:DNA polymerase-3 subunit beta
LAEPGVAMVRATNLKLEIAVEVPAEVGIEGGAALPGEVPAGLVKRLPKGGQLALEMHGERAIIVSGTAKFDLRTLPVADYPRMPDAAEDAVSFDMPAADLKRLMTTVYASNPKSDVLWHGGVFLHIGDRHLNAVASNGMRIAMAKVDIPRGAATMPGVVIPAGAAEAVLNLLGKEDVSLTVSPRLFELRADKTRLSTVLIGVTYPDYARIMPQPKAASATFRPYALAEALRRASAVYLGLPEKDVSRTAPEIRINICDGALLIEAGKRGSEQASETVDAETNGHPIATCVNGNLLAEMLAVWPETCAVGVEQEDPTRAILFTAADRPDQVHAIMPMARKEISQ